MKSAFRQNAEAQKFVQQKTTLAAAGQRLYNQTKNRKEGFQVNIKIIQRQCGGTEFLSQPHRLHLGAQNAAGVDELCFTLPEAWAGCTVALYLRRSDGTLRSKTQGRGQYVMEPSHYEPVPKNIADQIIAGRTKG